MKELITELLNFRKQELGFMKIYVSQHNLVEFLYENYLLFEGYAKAKNVDIRFESMEQSIEVWYDAKQMQKVVNNLLSNALKHTTSGESITISVSKTEDTAIFKVIDTGCGIGVEDIGHIFDRFYQVESQNLDLVDTGTGIGLALTKNIIDLHHGEIEVESALNEGSAFSVRLKLGNTHFSGEEINDIEPVMNNTYISTPVLLSMEEMSVDILPDQQQKDIKMLIVEDNEELRNMLNDTFIPFYQVITASDGAEGLEKAKTELPNIIVSDVVMPPHDRHGVMPHNKERCEHMPYSNSATDRQNICGKQSGRAENRRRRLYIQAVQCKYPYFALQQPCKQPDHIEREILETTADDSSNACNQYPG